MKRFLSICLRNDHILPLLFLACYLCTNSYTYAWDDQHLEIPLLKHLIDPTLYKGDYYVEGLAHNFTSYLYVLLAKVIRIPQIPTVYFILFLIARYAMFFWVYKLWRWLAQARWPAAAATLMFILLGRTEEFLYRTFSHQEFSYIFMFPGLYYFYRERFVLAAAILGIGANFNAIYNLFPMMYILAFLLFTHKERWKLIVKTSLAFIITASPFLAWQIQRMVERKLTVGSAVPIAEWMPLYLISCQQNFLFWTKSLSAAMGDIPFVLGRLEPYLMLLVLYAVLCVWSVNFRRDLKVHTIVAVSYFLIVYSFVFSYIYPSRFMIDLNLLRSEQFVRFFLMGYLTITAVKYVKQAPPWKAMLTAVFLCLASFGSLEVMPFKIKRYIAAFVFIVLGSAWLIFRPKSRHAALIRQLLIAEIGRAHV